MVELTPQPVSLRAVLPGPPAQPRGGGRVALRRAVRYGNERVVFGRPIGMNQGLQFPIADAQIKLDAATLMVRKAAWLYDQGMPCGREANAAKYLCAEAGFEAAYFSGAGASFSLIGEPDLGLYMSQSRQLSEANYARDTDKALDGLYLKQSRAADVDERRKYVRDFERRLLDEEAHYIWTLQWHRIIPHLAKVHGWTVTPSHYLNNQLDTVWLAD